MLIYQRVIDNVYVYICVCGCNLYKRRGRESIGRCNERRGDLVRFSFSERNELLLSPFCTAIDRFVPRFVSFCFSFFSSTELEK